MLKPHAGWPELEPGRVFVERRGEGERWLISSHVCQPLLFRLLAPFHSLLQLENAERRCYLVCHKPAILLVQSQVSEFAALEFHALIGFLPEP